MRFLTDFLRPFLKSVKTCKLIFLVHDKTCLEKAKFTLKNLTLLTEEFASRKDHKS